MIDMTASEAAKRVKIGAYLLPARLRTFVRIRKLGGVAVGIFIGLLSGLLVTAISKLSDTVLAVLFDIQFDAHLSATG
jgi:CIC family chloride channel protein